MKYLCMVIIDEKKLQSLSEAEAQALVDESLEYDDVLRKGGHFVAAQALESVSAATTIRLRSGKVTMTDGPFAETREQLGGYYLVEAKDLDEAITIAARIPSARYGSIEIRPVQVYK